MRSNQILIRGAQATCLFALAVLLGGCSGGNSSGGSTVAAIACPATQTQAMQPAPPPGMPGITLNLQQVNTDFALTAPLFLTAPPGDTARLFVVEQGGLIKVIDRSKNALIGTFLNISNLLPPNPVGTEQGLLGMAFDPQYQTNGRFYVSYTDSGGNNTVVARYLVSGNPDVAISTADRIIMTAAQPFTNHNGGMIAFGPDGYLYIGRGDGGSGNDPDNRAQNAGEVLGKLLRIDVSQGTQPPQPAYAIPPDNPCVGVHGARGEIWSIGLRNRWRYSFDRISGDLYIADVGQSAREEVNVSTVATGAGRGTNFGWKIMEGTLCRPPTVGCSMNGLQLPAVEYDHPTGCSITGGYAYRGAAIPALPQGTYFYGDFCVGFVRSFRFVNGQVIDHVTWPSLTPGNITSFGEDAAGELYIMSSGGSLFRITN